MGEENLDIYYSLENLHNKILFVNKVLFSKDDDEALYWLIKFEDESTELPSNPDFLEDFQDYDLDNTIEYNNVEYTVEEYTYDDYFIDITEDYKITVVMISDKFYVNYSNVEHLEYFKKTLFNNNILFVEEKDEITPPSIAQYFTYRYSIVYNRLGLLPFNNCLS